MGRSEAVRLAEAKPTLERFFAWVDKLFEGQGFLPSSPLTTRCWKELFADKPLRSDLYDLAARRNHAAG